MDCQRAAQRQQFLAQKLNAPFSLIPLPQDASNRRYFRVHVGDQSMMLMDAPPSLEKPALFVSVTEELARLGARAPAILHSDLDTGLLLIEDLGDQTMTRLLAAGEEEASLYQIALDALMDMQHQFQITKAKPKLAAYDLETVLTEVNLFVDWYLPAATSQATEQQCKRDFVRIWTGLNHDLPPIEPVLVHRDFHVDNLIINAGQCAMLDYQDALIGSPAYDVVSLLEDARRDLAPGLAANLTRQWLSQRTESADVLEQHLVFWGAQRHAKVAGIFVRLWLRDHKPDYLQHLGRVMELLQRHLSHVTLAPLNNWFESTLEQVSHTGFRHSAESLRRFI